jgi:acetylornithine deacetylase
VTDTLPLLERLVAIDTTSSRSNLPLIHLAQELLAPRATAGDLLPEGDQYGLVATVGPAIAGGIVLCAHTDTVPVDAGTWTHDPFRLTRSGDRLLGRGAADMKGFIAAALSAMVRHATDPLARPVTLALTHSEEVGCRGAKAMASALVAGPLPAAVVVGEPTMMRVAEAHKGIVAVRTSITTRPGHSFHPDRAASAVSAAAQVVGVLESIGRRWRGEIRDSRFDPPHPTVSVGTIEGGAAVNVVPGHCSLTWECRTVPDLPADEVLATVEAAVEAEVLPRLRSVDPGATVVHQVLGSLPPLRSSQGGSVAELVSTITAAPRGPAPSFATDAAVLQDAGLPCVVCGPGSMEQGHTTDEYIEVSQLEECDGFMDRVFAWAAEPALVGVPG